MGVLPDLQKQNKIKNNQIYRGKKSPGVLPEMQKYIQCRHKTGV